MASPTLVNPTSQLKTHLAVHSKLVVATVSSSSVYNAATPATLSTQHRRREILSLAAVILSPLLLSPASPALAESDGEYVKETEEVISKVRNTISMERSDPNVATAVTELRETSNSWVAKYRKEKSLLGRTSFRDMYSALNAISGHYISFGPTTPIPAKRRVRILEEMDTAEKALLRGR